MGNSGSGKSEVKRDNRYLRKTKKVMKRQKRIQKYSRTNPELPFKDLKRLKTTKLAPLNQQPPQMMTTKLNKTKNRKK